MVRTYQPNSPPVHLQTSSVKHGMLKQGIIIYRSNNGGFGGVKSLYSGLTASMGRQMTYSLTRFAAYDLMKSAVTGDKRNLYTYEKVLVAFAGGCMGGIIGTPCDLVNVRMQNDSKLPLDQRRNYAKFLIQKNDTYIFPLHEYMIHGIAYFI